MEALGDERRDSSRAEGERERGRHARGGGGERIRIQTGPGPYDFFISSGRISAPNERVKGVRSTK